LNPLSVYLADLTHVGGGTATEAFPLNLGVITTYAKKAFGDDVEISLFKFPDDLRDAIRDRPPHILGCSNYTWNSNLSYHFCSWVKSIDPNVLTVFGGTNYPFDAENQSEFLKRRPALDVHIYYEGEQAFVNIVRRVLSKSSYSAIFEAPIDGCQFIDPATGEFVEGESLPRIRDLDSIPSPYVAGILDKFFERRLTPFVETARGCPFTCNFCNAYHGYFTKVNLFSDEYVREELLYVAERASSHGLWHLTMADNNFGMIPRDEQTAQLLGSLQQSHGWPRFVSIWTGKNAKERVIDVTRLLGNTLSISMSVQSMDEEVLENVGRRNIKLDDYRKIADELNEAGRPQHAEVIMPLPGETLESHIRGLNELLDSNVSRVLSHQLQLLHGTPYKDDPGYRERFGYGSRYRIVPLDFSRVDGEYILDYEEVAVETNTMSFEEYVLAREYLLVIDLCYNSDVFKPLIKYLASLNIENSRWIQHISENVGDFPPNLASILAGFRRETVTELWDNEEDLVAHYSTPENFDKLISYDAGGNVLFKHRVRVLMEAGSEWVDAVCGCTEELVLGAVEPEQKETVRRELECLRKYMSCTVVDTLTPRGVEKGIEETFHFDVLAWMPDRRNSPLSCFADDAGVALRFSFRERTAGVMRDAFKRYGENVAGLTKMIQRTAGIGFTRDVAYASGSAVHSRIVEADEIPDSNLGENRSYGPGFSSL
jgi:radical SAM superfamily enzyme YgiQ (UPF0313 family)